MSEISEELPRIYCYVPVEELVSMSTESNRASDILIQRGLSDNEWYRSEVTWQALREADDDFTLGFVIGLLHGKGYNIPRHILEGQRRRLLHEYAIAIGKAERVEVVYVPEED